MPGTRRAVEILAPNINKGVGLRKLCEHEYFKNIKLSVQDVIAFGDGKNDYDFIRMAGYGVCMKNGQPMIQQIANKITLDDNNNDGCRTHCFSFIAQSHSHSMISSILHLMFFHHQMVLGVSSPFGPLWCASVLVDVFHHCFGSFVGSYPSR